MAGGTWSTVDKSVLPGMYVNFQAAALASIQSGARGVVGVPVKAHWGPVRSFVEITSEAGILENFGGDTEDNATALTTLKLALLGGAKKVVAYRLADNTATASALTFQDTAGTPKDVLKLNAKYPGARGNNFKVTIQPDIADAAKKNMKLYEGTKLLKTFVFASGKIQSAVDAINNDSGNVWVIATKLDDGSGELKDISNVALAGGNSGIAGVTATDYTNALTAFETRDFNYFALDGVSDSAIQASVVAWVKRIRSEGKGAVVVLGGSLADDTAVDAVNKASVRSTTNFNHEGVINVGTGVVWNGVSYSSAQVSAYVAGVIAGQKLSESATYAASPFSDVVRRWTRSEQELAVTNGVFLFYHDGRIVKSLRAVNSLVTLRQGQNSSWKKVRTIRVMDAINSDLMQAAESNYIGKVNNTEEGRLALVGASKQYMQSLVQGGVIEATGWDVYLNPLYYGPSATITPAPDQVYIQWEARLTDAMEQIFGTFIVL
ncbi:phage tail sheath family protein [Paenibacillus ehimensis]|uniref:phage tail sheath family protein n=1 Tax=Paenibacillus ehimensis TaxID=79264 RepID=UPI000471B6FD|nr:phage tail sheath family protein [Paenibacillus ehimensis]